MLTPTAARRVVAAGVIGFVALSTARAAKVAADGYTEGWGYANEEWRSSPAVAFVNELPSDAVVYTDDPLDTRGCDQCTCDEPAGSCTHPGIVLVGANDVCNAGQVPPAPGVIHPGDCVEYGGLQSVLMQGSPTPNTACYVDHHPVATGSVEPQGPITVCCEA